LPEGASAQLLAYLEQLHKWNKAYNLSGIKDIQEMLTLHLLDSLALAPLIDADPVADVGTGAGLPGIPLAICYPDKQFRLVDSNSKKTRFIFHVVAVLGLRNVEVVHSRAEDYESHPQVAIVTSRAFASLRDFVVRCDHMLQENGKFLAMKGLIPDTEIADLPAQFAVTAIHPLSLPGSAHVRHVLDIRRVGPKATNTRT
jgi:16S rRNA (guanine527-N7)-methyltransferase